MKKMLVCLNTYALNATVMILDNSDLEKSFNVKVPYHSFSAVATLANNEDVDKIILQGSEVFCEDYKTGLEEAFNTLYNKKQIEITIDGGY